MLLVLTFLPLISAIFLGFLGKLIGPKGSTLVALCCMAIATILSIFSFWKKIEDENTKYIKINSWIDLNDFNINWEFVYDSLSITMLATVTIVSFLVHVYSTSYMEGDPHIIRFISYLSLFTFFMNILTTSTNFVQLFVGWEGVGICSYLLINFWFTRIQANKSALKALMINRIGDFFLILAMGISFKFFKTLDFDSIYCLVPYFQTVNIIILEFKINSIELVAVFLLLAAVGKSAQIGLHTWLPDAMEGPTPVSALIHAATMVTAGIFLIVRCSFIFEYAPATLKLTTLIGATTAFFAATIGIVQHDIKKIIAYSTCSQLGYMAFICGLSQYHIGLFHLVNHAFFKALLFLGAGSVIHAFKDEQDLRKLGGSAKMLPITYSTMLIGSLALAGFPFLSGFYSKDAILEIVSMKRDWHYNYAYILGYTATLLTSFYSFRLLYYTFVSKTNGYKKTVTNLKESDVRILIPIVLLSILSIFSGFILKELFIGLGSNYFNDSIYIKPDKFNLSEHEFLSYKHKLLPIIISLTGLFLGNELLKSNKSFLLKLKIKSTVFYKFLIKKWNFDKIYNVFANNVFKMSYNSIFKIFDKGVIELIGPYGLIIIIHRISIIIKRIHHGSIIVYLLYMMIFIVLIILLSINFIL